ncbi:MAG TPA: glycosyltransferase [Parafilimonas sp.]|nr:glycosyltransferase [Parafilimonas sp.]
MQVLTYILYGTALLLCVYLLIVNLYLLWFSRLKSFQPNAHHVPQTGFSIVIPARNEEEKISACLQSVLKNNYPLSLYEIIVVDDFSTDSTAFIVQDLQKEFSNIKLISLKELITESINSYKKRAIEIAIGKSKFEWIITTDADCVVQPDWLKYFDAYIQKFQPVFVAAPVMFNDTGSFLSKFQCLDFVSLQGITAASVSAGFHSMCNGANLAYSKKAFYDVGGFKDADDIASGDDMLLMHKIKLKYPPSIGYLFNRNVIVKTDPMGDWKSFLNQRIRWASKATSYRDLNVLFVLLLVYFVNLCLGVIFILCFFYPRIFLFLVLLVLTKALFELPFMYKVSRFFSLQKLMPWFVIMQPAHIVYTIISGWLGRFGTYQWKGRKVK